jgi:4-amino-4-deoxy-L-arabinose transferase-like glycosyltransferase
VFEVVLDKVPPAYDYARHLYIAFLYWQAFDWNSQSLWFDLLSVEPFYPPLYHLSVIPFALVFGFSAYSAVLANSIYLGVIILSTYGIGALTNDRRTGLMAAFLVACYPFLSYVSRTPMIDTMLTAAVAAAYYLFLKSKNFENRFYSLMFTLVFAGGMMVKWTFLVFIFPAVVLGLVGDKPAELKQTLIHFIYYLGMILALLVMPLFIFILEEWKWVALFLEICLVGVLLRTRTSSGISRVKVMNVVTLTWITLIICFPWYSHAFLGLVRGGMKSNLSGIREGDPTAGIDRWIQYAHFLQNSVGGILFLLFLIGIIFYLVRRKYFNPLLVGWLFFAYVIFSWMTNHDTWQGRHNIACIVISHPRKYDISKK